MFQLTDTYMFTIFTETSEFVDACDDTDTLGSILYGDLSYHEGTPRIIQIPLGDEGDEAAEQASYLARINADCFGIPLDTIERVLV